MEPVHSVPLLSASELGIPGALLVLLAGVGAMAGLRQAKSPAAAALSASVIGLMAAGLLDHFLWSLAPGRALIFLFLGLWAGQINAGESAVDKNTDRLSRMKDGR
jgi:F0F1-type ATP synthase assembly protein I